MSQPASALLRKAGKELSAIGQQIEDSQVEDGDPPYEIDQKLYVRLSKALICFSKALRVLRPGPLDEG
jgi:hypothetical protein